MGRLRTLICTAVLPLPTKPSRSAAALETSTKSPVIWGPRSFTRRTKDLLFLRLVTSIFEPRGKVRCAAVSSLWSNLSPLAVTPADSSPYQLAKPSSLGSELMGSSVIVGTARGKADHASDAWTNEAGGLASDGAVKATTAATPQPVTSLRMPPPNNVCSTGAEAQRCLSECPGESLQKIQNSVENVKSPLGLIGLIGLVGIARHRTGSERRPTSGRTVSNEMCRPAPIRLPPGTNGMARSTGK